MPGFLPTPLSFSYAYIKFGSYLLKDVVREVILQGNGNLLMSQCQQSHIVDNLEILWIHSSLLLFGTSLIRVF